MQTVLQAAKEIDSAFVHAVPLCSATVSLRTRIRNGFDTRAINTVKNVQQFAATLEMTVTDYTFAATSALRLQFNPNRLNVLSIGNKDLFERIQKDNCAALYITNEATDNSLDFVGTGNSLLTFAGSLITLIDTFQKLEQVVTDEVVLLVLLGRRANMSEHMLYDHPEINDHWKTVGDSFLPGRSYAVVGQEHFELWRVQREAVLVLPNYTWWQETICKNQNVFSKYAGGKTSECSGATTINIS